jgi:ribosome-binding protein aMBF1 (putative translation factor)
MNPGQIRAARALLGWSRVELAKEARISAATVKNIESGRTCMHEATRFLVEEAFLKQRIIFTSAGGVERI